jgi:hypothetical protein
MMFSSQPCSRFVPAIMLATQPASAPKMIQEMMPRLPFIVILRFRFAETRRRRQTTGPDGGVKSRPSHERDFFGQHKSLGARIVTPLSQKSRGRAWAYEMTRLD